MTGSDFRSAMVPLGCLIWIGIGLMSFVPFGIWKVVELLISLFHHIHWI